jgi:peptide/nickel transport system substrate-binding protein
MKKILALLLCAAMVLACFSGCAAEDSPYVPTGDALAPEDADVNATIPEEEGEPQEITLAYYDNRSMNPIIATDFTNRSLFSLIYQGLFFINRNNEPVPILCKQYKYSSDYRTFTFFLMDGARFSDGTPVTVEDALATYSAALKSSYYKSRFMHVKEILISDEGGLSFKLSNPITEFPLLLDVPIVKADQVEAEHPLGSGPYIFEKGLTGTQLRRNRSWWCADSAQHLVVTADSIPLIAATTTTQIRDEFEFGEVGVVCTDPCSDSYADYRCDRELWNCENGMFLFLACNVAYSEVFSNDALRATLTFAIDRQALADTYYRGFAQTTTIACSPSSPYYSPALAAKYEYEPIRFIDALSKIKMPKEPVRLLVNKDDSLRLRAARDIAEMLTECGLETVTVEQPTNKFLSDVRVGKYDLYLGQTRLSTNMDLTPFFHPYGNMSRNGISDPDLYALCLDTLENSGNFYNLHKAVAEDGCIVPILFGSYAVYATRGLVTNLSPSRDCIYYYTIGRTDSDAMIPYDYTNG